MSGRDLGEIKIIAGWSRYKSEMSTGVSGGEKLLQFSRPRSGENKSCLGSIFELNS